MDEVNAENARKMFGEGFGDMVYFEFAAEPNVAQPMSAEQAYEIQFRLINFLKEQGFGFDGTARLTTWKKERERKHGA